MGTTAHIGSGFLWRIGSLLPDHRMQRKLVGSFRSEVAPMPSLHGDEWLGYTEIPEDFLLRFWRC